MYRLIFLLACLSLPCISWAQLDLRADSLARKVLEAAGGAEVWSNVPYVIFSQATEINREPNRIIRHLWNRKTNQYRMELPGPAGKPYVVLFDIDTRQGTAYWDGVELEPREVSQWIEQAYQRFVNDTFWLFAPMFLFDAGVERSFIADSSTDAVDILHLQFALPDLAPAEEFYLQVDRSSAQIRSWKYRGLADDPEGPFRVFEWRQFERYPTPVGDLLLSTSKRALGHPYEVVTRAIQFPPEVPSNWFTDGVAKLTPSTDSP